MHPGLPDCQEIKAFLDSHAELLDDGKHWAAVDDEDLSAQATIQVSVCDRLMFAWEAKMEPFH